MNEDTGSSPSPQQSAPGHSQSGRPSHHQGRDRRGRGRWRRFRKRDEPPAPEISVESLNLSQLQTLPSGELEERIAELGVAIKGKEPRQWMPEALAAYATKQGLLVAEGILELGKGGFGFLRSPALNYQVMPSDAYVSNQLVRRYGLKNGDLVAGLSRAPRERERYHSLLSLELIWGDLVEKSLARKPYDELTPLHPEKRMVLETVDGPVSTRALDLLAPLGRGQRCLLIAPPRAGKTILMQQIAEAVGKNDPDVEIIMLLLDERPEEVYNMRRVIKGEVVSSTFDETTERHLRMADLIIEKAHRMLENGRHVVLFLDSLTRLARACNSQAPARGKLMSGGIDSGALSKPRKFFSSARNVEGGGSLTIVATVLVETGSRADDLIFEEFKGTGNMEVHLSRDLQERRIYPAIHIEKTGTRREELLYHPDELLRIQALRRQLSENPPLEAMEKLIEQLSATSSNAELLMRLKL